MGLWRAYAHPGFGRSIADEKPTSGVYSGSVWMVGFAAIIIQIR